MSGTFNLLFTRASEAAFSAYNALGSVFNLAELPPVVSTVFSPKLIDLSSHYDPTVLSNPDLLFTYFKSRFQQQVENHWFKPIVQNFISSGNLASLDTELQNYLDHYFPQLNFLLSDECLNFIASHLPHLHSVDAQSFCESLSGYLNKLWEDLEGHINYEDKISDVFLNTRNQIAGLKSYLQSSVQTFRKPSLPKFSSVTQAVLSVTRRAASYMALHPLQAFVGGVALFGQRALAADTEESSEHQGRELSGLVLAPPINVTIGKTFNIDIYSYYLCGLHPSPDTILICPTAQMTIVDFSAIFPQYPLAKWITYSGATGMNLMGTPLITERFWQGFQYNMFEYTCPTNFGGNVINCPSYTPLGTRFFFWLADTPPYALLTNTTLSYPNTTFGAQPLLGFTKNGVNQPFAGNFLQNGVGDNETDTSTQELYLPSSTHGASSAGHIKPPSRISINSVTGDISFVPTSGDEGRWFFDLFVYNTAWNLKPNVWNYNLQQVTWESFFWATSYIDIQNSAPTLKPLLNALYTITPGNTLTINFGGVFKDPNGNNLQYFLTKEGNETTLSAHFQLDDARQLISFSPTSDERTTNAAPYVLTLSACNQPGANCAEVIGCIPAESLCTTSSPFSLIVANNPPAQIQPFFPSQTTISTATSLTNVLSKFSDLDSDTLSFSIQRLDGDQILPSGLSINSNTGDVSWLPIQGTATGTNYQFQITADDDQGGTASGIWTVTLNDRPAQINPGLSDTLASIGMQNAGSANFPFPFSDPDLTASQISTLISQTTVTIPTSLQPYVHVNFDNASLQYSINWNPIPGFAGSWPILFTHINPINSQQTSVKTNLVINNAGPYLISAPSLQTGLIGSSVNFNLISHFGHLDNAATLTYSIALPNGLRISNGQILGTIQTKTAGVYDPPITVTDNMGKTLLPLPTLSLTIPATTPTLINPGTLTAVINSGSSIPTLSSQFQVINPDQNNYQVSKVGSNPPMLTVNSDGSYFLTPQNTQQGNYTAVIQITNGIGTTQINVPIVISRASLQLPSFVPTLQAFIAQLVQLDACTLVNDADNPGSCSNFDLSWSLPSELKASNTTAASASTMGSLLSLNAAFNSEVQGTYTAALTLRDLRSTHTYQVQIPIQFLNKAPKAAVSLQTLLNQNSQSTFTVPDPVFTDPDGDNLSVMASVPTRCTRDPIQKQTTCTKLTPAIYDLVYTATDSSMTNATSTVRIPINPAPVTNIFIELFSKAGPGVLLPVATAMLFLAKYWFWDRPKTAALNKLEKTLKPMVILLEQVHKKYKWLPMESHPLGLPHTHGSTPKPTPEAAPAIDFTPAASTPISVDAGIGVGLLAEAKCIPSPPSSHALVKRHSITPGITHSRDSVLAIRRTRLGDRAVEISNQLTTAILNVTDSESSIETFQALFGEYLGCLDEYHATGSRDVTSECNVMTVLTALSNRFDKSLGGITREKSGLHITPRIKALIDWLEKLSTRFVSYHSGSIIDLAEKFNLAQAITDCIKAVRQHLKPKKSITPSDHPQELEQEQETIGEQRALLATQELLRGMITSVKDDDEASIRRTFTCSRREVKSETRTLHKKILIPKMWIAPAMFFRNISQIGTSHPDNLEIFKMLNKVVSGINVHQPTRVNFWQVCTQKPLKIKFLGKECTFSPLSPSQASRANYWAWDAYMALMDNWSPASQFEAKIENEKMACLAEGLKNLLGLPLKDKLGEDKIRSFVLTRLGQSLQNFLVNPSNQLTVKQATSLLLKLSPYFSDPQINQMVTDYVLAISKQTSHDKTTNNKLAAFCREFKAQYAIASESNPSKIKELRAWLDSAPREIKEIREIAQLKSELILTTHRWSFSSFRSSGSNGSSSPRSASPHGTTMASVHRKPTKKPTHLDSIGAHHMVIDISNPLPSTTTRIATVIRHQAPMAPEEAIPKRGDRAGRTSLMHGNKGQMSVPGMIGTEENKL